MPIGQNKVVLGRRWWLARIDIQLRSRNVDWIRRLVEGSSPSENVLQLRSTHPEIPKGVRAAQQGAGSWVPYQTERGIEVVAERLITGSSVHFQGKELSNDPQGNVHCSGSSLVCKIELD